MRLVELFELQSREGPCQDCFRTGQPVVNHDLSRDDSRWPRFAAVAVNEGFRAADAIPMRLRSHIIGALNLFRSSPGALNDDDVAAAQALADIATIAIVQHRALFDAHVLNEQLASALASRILIEQAKGMIAERRHLPIDDAFATLRHHARRTNQRSPTSPAASSTARSTRTSSTLHPDEHQRRSGRLRQLAAARLRSDCSTIGTIVSKSLIRRIIDHSGLNDQPEGGVPFLQLVVEDDDRGQPAAVDEGGPSRVQDHQVDIAVGINGEKGGTSMSIVAGDLDEHGSTAALDVMVIGVTNQSDLFNAMARALGIE
jgi:hypothetical protein